MANNSKNMQYDVEAKYRLISRKFSAKTHHFPTLVWRGGGIDFQSLSYNIEDNLAEYLILTTQDCAMKFLPQAIQYHGHL